MAQPAQPAGETAQPELSQVFTSGKRGLSYPVGIASKFQAFQK